MYNRVNCSKKIIMLSSYLHGIHTSIFPNRHYDNIFSGKLANKLNALIENHPHVIHLPNVSESLFIKIDGTK